MAEQRAIDALVQDVYRGAVSRRTLLKRGAALGLATPTLMALLAACGDDDDDAVATAPPAAEPTPVPADEDDDTDEPDDEPTEVPADEDDDAADEDDDTAETPTDPVGEATGEIVIMQGVDSNNLDPLLRNSVPEFTVNMHVFDMMLKRDAETLEIQPNIIAEWETIDELTWEFTLVEGAEFHDGTPVNAEAAVFTFERASQPQIGELGRVQSLTAQIGYESAEVVDEYTFRVITNKPAAIFPDLLTSFEICPPSQYEDDSSDNLSYVAQNPMGSGPYKFVEWVRDDRVVLEANENYWGTPPQIARVVIRPVPELSARVVALQNEEAHIIVNVAPEVVQQVDEGANTRISSVTGGRNIFVGIRCDKEPFGDVRVRQALNYAVDWESIRIALLEGFGERTKTIVNPPNDNPNLEAYPYDPDRARELLAEAGVEEGFTVVMDAPNGRYIKDSDLAQAVAQNFEAVGLNIDLRVLEWSVYAGELLPSGNPDPLFFLGLGSPFSGEQELFYVHPDFSLNYTFWEDEEFVDKFAQLNQSVDVDERRELMYELQEIVMRECPWVFLWHQVDFYGAAENLTWEARADERIWVAESSVSI
jgi:peptide/nickel transport system substrate-binding protein